MYDFQRLSYEHSELKIYIFFSSYVVAGAREKSTNWWQILSHRTWLTFDNSGMPTYMELENISASMPTYIIFNGPSNPTVQFHSSLYKLIFFSLDFGPF